MYGSTGRASPAPLDISPRAALALIAWLNVGILALDSVTPLGMAVGLFYLIPLWLTSWLPDRRYAYRVAAIGVALTLIGWSISEPAVAPHIVLFNRLMSIGLIGLMAVFLTVRRTIEEDLREKIAELENILGHLHDGVVCITPEGIITAFNHAAERLFGYAARDVIGRNVNLLMPEPYHSQHNGYLAAYRATGIARILGLELELLGLRKDKSVFPLELVISEVSSKGKRLLIGAIRDLTVRKQAEEARRLSQDASALPQWKKG